MQQCWGEGVYGNIEPTHIRLAASRFEEVKRLFGTVKYGGPEPITIDNMVFNNAALVFTPEVDEKIIQIVNINWLHPVYQTYVAAFLDKHEAARFTFTRIIEGAEICGCCGQEIPAKGEPTIEIYSPPEAMWHCDDCGHGGMIAATTTKEQALVIHAVGSPNCKAHSFWTKKR
jgi:hypothetical protein